MKKIKSNQMLDNMRSEIKFNIEPPIKDQI